VAHAARAPQLLGFGLFITSTYLQLIEALKGTEKFLKVPLRGTFKNFSGFHVSAKRCITLFIEKLYKCIIPEFIEMLVDLLNWQK